MEMDKLKQWMEIAQNMHGKDFWQNIFDQDFAKEFMQNGPSPSPNGPQQHTNQQRKFPLIDLIQTEDFVKVIIELPGIRKEDVELGIKGNVLTVKGVAQSLTTEPMTYSERFYGQFLRQIELPDIVSPNQISAKFWNGILFVSYKRQIEESDRIIID